MLDTLVINASPLIFLGNAGQINLLRALDAERFVVPPAVFDEVAQHVDRAARSLPDARWLERGATVQIPPSVLEWDLGPGESAVIATCLEPGQARPVLDDQGRWR